MTKAPFAFLETHFAGKNRNVASSKLVYAPQTEANPCSNEIEISFSSKNPFLLLPSKIKTLTNQSHIRFWAIQANSSLGTHQNVLKSFPNVFFH